MGRGRKRHRRKAVAILPPVEIAEPVDLPEPPKSELVPIASADVEEIWPLAESLLAPELPNQDMTSEQLRDSCMYGGAQLWIVCGQEPQAAMVTIQAATGRCIVAICCGNNLWDYLEARHQLYEWAKEQGMREVVFYGRDALAKLMPECKRGGVILRKEL
jgi:hypothetical protein